VLGRFHIELLDGLAHGTSRTSRPPILLLRVLTRKYVYAKRNPLYFGPIQRVSENPRFDRKQVGNPGFLCATQRQAALCSNAQGHRRHHGKDADSNIASLERDGLIQRKACAVVPPKVEYRISPLGHSLAPVLAIVAWSSGNLVKVQAAREAFAKKAKKERSSVE
jgi:HxlR-like helix-turn-helix